MVLFEALSTTFLILIKETEFPKTNIRIAQAAIAELFIYIFIHSSLSFILITYIFSFMVIYYQSTEKN